MHDGVLILGQETTSEPVDACGDPGEASYVCRQVFEWTESELLAKGADWFVARPLSVLLILVVAWAANRLARRAIRRFVEHAKDDEFQRRVASVRRRTGVALLDTGPVTSARRAQRAEAIGAVMRSITTGVVYSLALLLALAELGVELGPLIAGAGIVGVALGFGAQSLVRDFLSGGFMLIEDQFGIGDVIDVGDAIGVVEGISLRTTKLRDLDGTLWHVPNGEVRRVGNKSQEWARALLDISVAYGTNIDRAAAVILRVAETMRQEEEFRNVIIEDPEIWGVQLLGADGVAIRLVIKVRPGEQWNLERKFRWRIKDAFDAEGIEIPFPQRTVWVRREDIAAAGDVEGEILPSVRPESGGRRPPDSDDADG